MKQANELQKNGVLFPPPGQLLLRGSKLKVIEMLQLSAAKVTKTPYPLVLNLGQVDHEMLTELREREHLYIKRSFSECGMHTGRPSDEGDFNKLADVIDEVGEYYGHADVAAEGIIPVWFGLSYIPGFLEQGEVRVFFINGTYAYMIMTGGEEVTQIVGLDKVSYVLFQE